MLGANTFRLRLRSQKLTTDAQGHTQWQVVTEEKVIAAPKVAIVICDMWDNHWSRGAVERESAMVPRMNGVVGAARERGVTIIHAPSETMAFYADHAARERMLSIPQEEPPADLPHDDPPLPVDDSDGGSDTGETSWHKAWTRQHPGIDIRDEDFISDSGREIYSLLQAHDLQQVLIMGVHTGMCILHRSFGIKQMAKWGVGIALVRDLTDALYNPAKPPYVSHDEGTQLIIGFIEKFWCPSVESREVIGER
jgi:nicotinamidase-related amidase